MATPILNISELAGNQAQPYLTVNEALRALEASVNDVLQVDSEITLTDEQFRSYGVFSVGGAYDLTVPDDIKRVFIVIAEASDSVVVKTGSDSVVVPPSGAMLISADGSGGLVAVSDASDTLQVTSDGDVEIPNGYNFTVLSGRIEAGDPGNETGAIAFNGGSYQTGLRVSDIGTGNDAQFILHRHSTTLPSLIVGTRSNSDTASHANVTNGQQLLNIWGAGWAGTDYKPFAGIEFLADTGGTISDTSSPGRIRLRTAQDGSTALTNALVIDRNQGVTIPNGQLIVNNGAPTGASASANADDFVIDNSSGVSGATILTTNSGNARLNFGSPSENSRATLYFGGGSSLLLFGTLEAAGNVAIRSGNNADAITIDNNQDVTVPNGNLVVGDESSPDVTDGGLCLQQGGNDGNILTLKSTDVSQPVTNVAESDTYAQFLKFDSSNGGLNIDALSQDNGPALVCRAYVATERAGATGSGAYNFDSYRSDGGTGATSLTNAGNLLSVKNAGATKVLIKGNGDLYTQGGISFDDGTNTLSEYEVGGFTPEFVGVTTPGSFTYTEQTGIYVRLGDTVFVSIGCRTSSIDSAPSGDIRIDGLPFTVASNAKVFSQGAIAHRQDDMASGDRVACAAYQSTTQIGLTKIDSAGNTSNITDADLGASPEVRIQFFYNISV